MLVVVLLGAIIYLNYWHGLEKKYVASGKTVLAGFTAYYLLYFIPFAAAFFLQLFFYKDCHYYKNGWFWAILLLAPAFFSFRVNFDWQEIWINNKWTGAERAFYQHSINWVVKVVVLLLPVLIVWLIKDSTLQPFYGTKPLTDVKPYLLMLLIMVPVIALASTQNDFLQVYPKAKLLHQIPLNTWWDQ